MNRLSEMLLGLEPRMPMCSVCKERPHILKKVRENEGAMNLYYCIECYPEWTKETWSEVFGGEGT